MTDSRPTALARLAAKAGVHERQGADCSCGEIADDCGRLSLWDEVRRLRMKIVVLQADQDDLHQLVCQARMYIDPEQHLEWTEAATAESVRCDETIATLRAERDAALSTAETLRAQLHGRQDGAALREIERLHALLKGAMEKED